MRSSFSVLCPFSPYNPSVTITHAHNELLQVAIDLGIPGFVAYVALLAGLNLGLGASMLAHQVFGLTDAFLLGTKPGVVMWMIMGLITGLLVATLSKTPNGFTMMRVVLDTALLVALVDHRDKWHSKALCIREELKAADAEVFYFDCVINEAISVLGRRLIEQKRATDFVDLLDTLERFVPAECITWVSGMIQRLYAQIIALVRAHAGELNFHDALICDHSQGQVGPGGIQSSKLGIQTNEQ